jgi:ABC-type nitrate/sulfonate/bicarbonate transport system ATPase subunit
MLRDDLNPLELVVLDGPERRTSALLAIDQLGKTFGSGAGQVQALSPTNLYVQEGDFLCVVGPSGCGKTTLLNLVAGFERPSSGQVRLRGQPITGPGAERGVVFQQGALFNWMTVLENVAFGPRACGVGPDAARGRARELLQLVGLEAFADKFPYQLSGGMQQRVGIARALANEPGILLMDEPFAALDQQTRELLQEEIRNIWRRERKTVLWITHSIDEALFLATHIAVMTARPGRIKAAFRSPFNETEDPLVAATPAFTAAKRQIVELLRAESRQAQAQESAA